MTGNVRYGYGLLAPEDSREALRLTLVAVPAGLVAGLLAGWVLSGRRTQR